MGDRPGTRRSGAPMPARPGWYAEDAVQGVDAAGESFSRADELGSMTEREKAEACLRRAQVAATLEVASHLAAIRDALDALVDR